MYINKTINVITPFYYPQINGVSFVAQQQVRSLILLGYHVNVITCIGCESVGEERVYCFDIKGNGTLGRPIRGDVDGYIYKLVELSKDCVCNFFHAWHSWSTNIGLINVDHLDTRNFIYSHGTSFTSDLTGLNKYIRRFIYLGEAKRIEKLIDKVDGLITITKNSTHHRCYDSKIFKGKFKFNLPNPIHQREFGIIDDIPEFENLFSNGLKTAFCISNYQRIKNQEFLLKLAYKLKFNIVFVGSEGNSYHEYLEKLIAKYGVENRVKLLVNVSDFVVSGLFKKCDFFLFASKNDFSPLTLIEANHFSLPFISFKTAEFDRKGGWFADNEECYEELLVKLLSLNKKELESIGNDGRIYYDDNNSCDAYMANIRNFLSL